MVAAGMTPEYAAQLVVAANRGHELAVGIATLREAYDRLQREAVAELECSDPSGTRARVLAARAAAYAQVVADLDRLIGGAA